MWLQCLSAGLRLHGSRTRSTHAGMPQTRKDANRACCRHARHREASSGHQITNFATDSGVHQLLVKVAGWCTKASEMFLQAPWVHGALQCLQQLLLGIFVEVLILGEHGELAMVL